MREMLQLHCLHPILLGRLCFELSINIYVLCVNKNNKVNLTKVLKKIYVENADKTNCEVQKMGAARRHAAFPCTFPYPFHIFHLPFSGPSALAQFRAKKEESKWICLPSTRMQWNIQRATAAAVAAAAYAKSQRCKNIGKA